MNEKCYGPPLIKKAIEIYRYVIIKREYGIMGRWKIQVYKQWRVPKYERYYIYIYIEREREREREMNNISCNCVVYNILKHMFKIIPGVLYTTQLQSQLFVVHNLALTLLQISTWT